MALAWGRTGVRKRGKNGDPKGSRTPVAGMKTRCPRPLDDGVAPIPSPEGLNIRLFSRNATAFWSFFYVLRIRIGRLSYKLKTGTVVRTRSSPGMHNNDDNGVQWNRILLPISARSAAPQYGFQGPHDQRALIVPAAALQPCSAASVRMSFNRSLGGAECARSTGRWIRLSTVKSLSRCLMPSWPPVRNDKPSF